MAINQSDTTQSTAIVVRRIGAQVNEVAILGFPISRGDLLRIVMLLEEDINEREERELRN